jgi:hypothetical protein
MITEKQKIEKHLALDTFGREEVAKTINKFYPKFHGSIKFNFKEGFYCNWQVEEYSKKIIN